MKLNTPYKTVLFYGHVLRVEKDKKYIGERLKINHSRTIPTEGA